MPVDHVGGPERPRIAVFAGSTATILNSAPLITSKAARPKHGLPPLRDRSGELLRGRVRRTTHS